VELLFKESFAGDLKAIKQKSVLPRIRQVLQAVANAEDLRSIPNIRKLNAPGSAAAGGRNPRPAQPLPR
jgi:hypothetical protein